MTQIYKECVFFCLIYYLCHSIFSSTLFYGSLPDFPLIVAVFSLTQVLSLLDSSCSFCYLHEPKANMLRYLSFFLHSHLQVFPFVLPKFGIAAYCTSSSCLSLASKSLSYTQEEGGISLYLNPEKLTGPSLTKL